LLHELRIAVADEHDRIEKAAEQPAPWAQHPEAFPPYRPDVGHIQIGNGGWKMQPNEAAANIDNRVEVH